MLIPCERGQTFVCDPARTALLCIDFQADFLANGGMAAERGLPFLELQRVIAPARRVLPPSPTRGSAAIIFKAKVRLRMPVPWS